jgi:hypothetical protein
MAVKLFFIIFFTVIIWLIIFLSMRVFYQAASIERKYLSLQAKKRNGRLHNIGFSFYPTLTFMYLEHRVVASYKEEFKGFSIESDLKVSQDLQIALYSRHYHGNSFLDFPTVHVDMPDVEKNFILKGQNIMIVNSFLTSKVCEALDGIQEEDVSIEIVNDKFCLTYFRFPSQGEECDRFIENGLVFLHRLYQLV